MHLPYGVVRFIAPLLVPLSMMAPASAVDYRVIDLTPLGITDARPLAISGNQQGGFTQGPSTDGHTHASFWNGTAGSAVDLQPSSFTESQVTSVTEARQFGYAYNLGTAPTFPHAFVWSGTAESGLDLTPSGYAFSIINGVSADQLVGGAGASGTASHATIWQGIGGPMIDVHPDGWYSSSILSTGGVWQVGFGERNQDDNYRALLWAGTRESAVDLTPLGADTSIGYGAAGDQQVGSASGADWSHAFLWRGTAESAIDLNPSGWWETEAFGTNGNQEVGDGRPGSPNASVHALLWNGSADDCVDLHQFLPEGFWGSSADAIDANGMIVGTAGAEDGSLHAILWVPVPEPSSIASFVLVALAAMRRRK